MHDAYDVISTEIAGVKCEGGCVSCFTYNYYYVLWTIQSAYLASLFAFVGRSYCPYKYSTRYSCLYGKLVQTQ